VDYDRDLATLAYLAGGWPADPAWRHYAEVWLWDFKDLPEVSAMKAEAGHWYETGRNIWLGQAGLQRTPEEWARPAGRIRAVPFGFEVSDGPDGPGLLLRSRWIRLHDFPARLRPKLVYLAFQRWGAFEEVPTPHNVRKALESFIRPLTPAEVYEIDLPDEADIGHDERAIDAARQRRHRLSRR
jgi:hypothetical protein